MKCSHCGKVLDNEKLSFCVYCGYPLKGAKQGFFAKSEKTGISRADELILEAEAPAPEPPAPKEAAPAPAPQQTPQPAPQPAKSAAQPQMNHAPQMAAQPVMSGMQTPQMGAAGVMPGVAPQMAAQPMQGIAPAPMGVQPNAAVMPNMQANPAMGVQPMMGTPIQPMAVAPVAPAPDVNGVMPQVAYGMPQMGYGMPQMAYGMPQFAGYDAAGNPIYMQMMPQFMGYDAYGNPVYNMVAVPYVMPAVQGGVGVQPMPQIMPQAYAQPEPVIDVPQEQIRPAEAAAQPAAAPQAYAQPPAPQQPVQERSAVITSSEDIPMDADALMAEEETSAARQDVPDEKEILDRIFSDAPKNYSMSEGAAPASAVFSINVGAGEITSIRDEEAPAPQPAPEKAAKKPAAPKPDKKAAKAEKPEKAPSKKKSAAPKKPATIVSPDDFFNDKPRAQRGVLNVAELDAMDDAQLAEHLAKQASTGGKRSTRSMKAASREEMDVSNIDAETLLGSQKHQLPQ